MSTHDKNKFMRRAIELGHHGMHSKRGGPFGAVIVKQNKIIGEGYNSVTSKNDPTAHAEIIAIRNACDYLDTFSLKDCEIYCSCEPCPMCLGAIYWARIERIYFASDRIAAAKSGFNDDFIYSEISLKIDERKIKSKQLLESEGVKLFEKWLKLPNKTTY